MRRALGTLICAVAVLALALCGSAAAAGSGGPARQGGIGALGNTVLTAIASTTNADEATRPTRRQPRPDGSQEQDCRGGSQGRRSPAQAGGIRSRQRPRQAARRPRRAPTAPSSPTASSLAGEKIVAHSREVAGVPTRSYSAASPSPRRRAGTIKAVINAANTIVGRPYIWGGGHASWYSYGYDCSGAVSFALSAAASSPTARLEPARVLGRARARQVDHRLRQRRPRLRRDRRPALGHRRRRPAAPARAGTSPPAPTPASSPATRPGY